MCSTDRPARGSGSNGASASGTAEDASRGSSSEAGRIRRLTPVESRHCATRAVSIAGGSALEAARRIAGALVGSFTPAALGEQLGTICSGLREGCLAEPSVAPAALVAHFGCCVQISQQVAG